jgi:hypothetical protein
MTDHKNKELKQLMWISHALLDAFWEPAVPTVAVLMYDSASSSCDLRSHSTLC